VNALALLSFASAIACSVLASAMIARDPGLKVNRLMGLVPLAVAEWGLMQALWTLQSDARIVAWMVKASSLGWMSAGSLAFHVFVELAGPRAGRLRRMVPWVYGLAFCALLTYVATPYGLGRVFPTSWGWGYDFGPLFPVLYLFTGVPVTIVLVCWKRVDLAQGSLGEQRVARVIYAGVGIGLGIATLTDGVLPALGHPVPQLAVPALSAVMLAVASQLRRFGFSVLSPSAFAEEILESLVDGVALLRPDGRIRQANGAFARMVREPVEALRERRVGVHLPDWPDGTAAAHAVSDVETQIVTSDGETIPVSVSSCVLERERGAILGQAIVVRDLRDVTELRERLVTSGRLAVVGELSAGIAHEIREPIAAVRRDLDALRRSWEGLAAVLEKSAARQPDAAALLSEGEELVDECIEGVDRVSSIIGDVAGLAERGAEDREIVDVNAVVERALRVAIPRDRQGIEVECRLAPLPPVSGFAAQLEQVFVNVLNNAVHAVGERGRIRVSTRFLGSRVAVRLEDDGHGIPAAVRDRIFDPFFTTKPVGEGTGLGLAISYHIVRNHQGSIRVESGAARGAVFHVELPVAGDRAGESVRVAQP